MDIGYRGVRLTLVESNVPFGMVTVQRKCITSTTSSGLSWSAALPYSMNNMIGQNRLCDSQGLDNPSAPIVRTPHHFHDDVAYW